MRPKVHYTRPAHPPPDPPIPEASALGQETRHSLFAPHSLMQAEQELTKQRHSFPDRLVRSRSSDIVCQGRRPTSDPGLNRRAAAAEERDPAGAFALGPSSSPSKDSLKGEVRAGGVLAVIRSDVAVLTHSAWVPPPSAGGRQERQRRREVGPQPTLVEETLCVGHPQRCENLPFSLSEK